MADFNPDEFDDGQRGLFGSSKPAQPGEKKLSTAQKVGIGAAATVATAGLATGLGFLVKHEVDKKHQNEAQAQAAQQAQQAALASANAQAAQAQAAAQQAQQQAAAAQAQTAAFQAQIQQLQQQQQHAAAPVAAPPQQNYAPPAAQAQYHTIQPGDTYWALSQKYGTTVQALEQLNPGVNYMNLQIGQQIRIR